MISYVNMTCLLKNHDSQKVLINLLNKQTQKAAYFSQPPFAIEQLFKFVKNAFGTSSEILLGVHLFRAEHYSSLNEIRQ